MIQITTTWQIPAPFLDVLRTSQFSLHGGVAPDGFSSDEKLQELAVDEQSIASGLDVLKHAVVSERVEPAGRGRAGYVAAVHHGGDPAVGLLEEY